MNAGWRQVERLLLVDNPASDTTGMTSSLEATWNVPTVWALALLASAACVILLVYLLESPTTSRLSRLLLAGIRTVLVGLVIFLLYGWTVERHRTELPDVVVVLDNSQSMGLADVYDDASLAAEIIRRLARGGLTDASRLNLAKTLLLENDASLLKRMAERYHLQFYLAGASSRVIGGERSAVIRAVEQATANESVSRLGNCLKDVLEAQRGRPTAAIVLITDGVTTDGKALPDVAQYARRKAVPIFTIGLGSDRPPRDLRLADLVVDEMVFAGDQVHFEVQLIAEGFTGAAIVQLKRPGEAQPLAEQKVALDQPGGSRSVRLSHRPDAPGEYEYTVEVVPREGEASIENNRLTRKVAVREELLRVLLVQAYPSYEFRFLKQMLARELNKHEPDDARSTGLRTVLQEADPQYTETDKTAERAFPVTRDELFQYDVLIVADVNPALLSSSMMNNIYEFVTVRGGGVIFVAGPRYMPLAYRDTPLVPLLPFNIDTVTIRDSSGGGGEAFRPRLTSLGRVNPIMQLADEPANNDRLWGEELAPLRWFANVADLRPGVQVLAEHPILRTETGGPVPIVCLQYIGAGKVLFQSTDETHRWRLGVGDAYFARYWVQAIRYLSRSKFLSGSRQVELTTDRDEYRIGDDVQFGVHFLDDRVAPIRDDGVTIAVERGNGERQTIQLYRDSGQRGWFAGSGRPPADGDYRAWLMTPELVGRPAAKGFSVRSIPGEFVRPQMDAAALRETAQVSGGRFYTFSTAGKLLADLPPGHAVRVKSLPPKPIWNAPLWAVLFVVLLTIEWVARRRVGLL